MAYLLWFVSNTKFSTTWLVNTEH